MEQTMVKVHMGKQIQAVMKACVSKDKTRYFLNGFIADEKDGKWYLAATDEHRLAVYKVPEDVELTKGCYEILKWEDFGVTIAPVDCNPVNFWRVLPDQDDNLRLPDNCFPIKRTNRSIVEFSNRVYLLFAIVDFPVNIDYYSQAAFPYDYGYFIKSRPQIVLKSDSLTYTVMGQAN